MSLSVDREIHFARRENCATQFCFVKSSYISILSFHGFKSIVKEIIRIQREFLWGGSEGQSKMCWLSWSKICRSKANGGLGVKHYEAFNLVLLSKWFWRILEGPKSIWIDLLRFRYGYIKWEILSRSYPPR